MTAMPVSSDFLSHLAAWAQTVPGGAFVFTTVLFLVVLSVLIFVHEFGHYAAARSVGIRVEVFAIGFGRRIAGWVDSHGTRWQVGWIPLGGYVQMLGQEDGRAYSHVDQPDSFAAKAVWQRAWVIVAGPLANLVFGFVLLVAIMLSGEHRMKAEVGSLVPDMPAAAVLQVNDIITTVNGVPVADWDAFQTAISEKPETQLHLNVVRAGQHVDVLLTPKLTTFKDVFGDEHTVGRVGVAPSYDTFVVQHGVVDGVARALMRTGEIVGMTVKSLWKLLIGAASPDNLSGPLGIANMTGQTAASGVAALMMFMVIITINLCIVNLFPIPVLDGGHLVFMAYEKLVGRAIPEKAQEWMLRAGLGFIIFLALFSTANDVKHMGLVDRISGRLSGAPAVETGTVASPPVR